MEDHGRGVGATVLARTDLTHPDGRVLHLYGDHGDGGFPRGDGATGRVMLHQRFDALTGTWIGISPARNTRPLTSMDDGDEPAACPLCPGGHEVPFPYTAAVFDNRFPTLLPAPPPPPDLDGPTAPARGRCEVVLYTSRHEGSLATLEPQELATVVAIWADRSGELWADPALAHVLVFENRGAEVGATISHPHGQIYGFDRLPPLIRRRLDVLQQHRDRAGHCLTCAVVERDDVDAERRLAENPAFTVAVPFAPRWPFEVHVRARRHGARRLTDLTPDERRHLADALRSTVSAYDALYGREFPYLMVVHEAPDGADGLPSEDWHVAVEFLPPMRGPVAMKIRASVETATGYFINDTLPEASAGELREALIERAELDPRPIPEVSIDSSVGIHAAADDPGATRV